jgi:NAD(P)-dependent dehydrogenase (short-subunit alcohol dehydrogenase family)
MHAMLIGSLMLFAALPSGGNAANSPDHNRKAILVTGASTGIGRKIAERLAADGYFVYAGARKEVDLQALGAIPNVQAVRLDVTRPEDVDATVETVTKAGRGLYGLVNNAGVVTLGPLIDTKPEEFDLVMKVNAYGPYRMTKAFAPLIIANHGRIINIGSISGILNETEGGAYQMSKHALETFSVTLAQELAPSDVHVSIVEPGSYKSDIYKNEVKRSGTGGQYADEWTKLKEPDDVAAAVESALFEPKPKLRYMVVPDQEQAEDTIKAQIEQLVQLNEGQRYTYDRTTLIKMLDAALVGARPRSK